MHQSLIDWLIDVMVFNAAFNTFAVISRRFLGKLPVLLVYLSRHQPVIWNVNPASLSATDGRHNYYFKSLWYDASGDRISDLQHPRRTLYHYSTEAMHQSYCYLFNPDPQGMDAITTCFKVFGMSRSGIEPWSYRLETLYPLQYGYADKYIQGSIPILRVLQVYMLRTELITCIF